MEVELEFYLLDPDEDDAYAPATNHNYENVTWATEAVSPLYDRVTTWADDYGIDLQSIEHEHGAGQLEVLFDYGSALGQADATFDFKRLIKRAAREEGKLATFMAKPFGDRSGSGYHLHVGAFDGDENVFEAEGSLSRLGRYFVGGVLDHADALSALGTPTLNAFKRYDPDSFASYTASWGYDNRLAAIRVPPGEARIENRIASADANPYSLIAAMLAAGIDGVEREREPTEPVAGNPTSDQPRLPRSPELALQALERDDTIVDALGSDFVRGYTAAKRRELAAFRDEVTGWEREYYAEML